MLNQLVSQRKMGKQSSRGPFCLSISQCKSGGGGGCRFRKGHSRYSCARQCRICIIWWEQDWGWWWQLSGWYAAGFWLLGLDLGIGSGVIGPTGAGLGVRATGCCIVDGGGTGMEVGSGSGVVIRLGSNGSLAMCQRSSSMVCGSGCLCTGMYVLKNLQLQVVILPEQSTCTTYWSNWWTSMTTLGLSHLVGVG